MKIARIWLLVWNIIMFIDFIVYVLSNMSVYVLSWFHRTCFVMISSYMFCRNFIVYALSWLLHRNERKWSKNNVYVRMLDLTPFLTCFLTWRISSYMLCQNFIVYALSKLHRICFVMTSSYMFCHDFFIVMSVYVLSWFLRKCFVMISSS